MSENDVKKWWACVVVGLLAITAMAAVDVAIILHEGVSVEYVSE